MGDEHLGTAVVVEHTGRIDAGLLAASQALLRDAFDDWTDDDWEHCLGGMHAIAVHHGEVVAHAALVSRRLLYRGRALRTGYVEGVAVRADVQRRGLGNAVMAPLEALARAAYDIAALGASDAGVPFYTARGWQRWTGPTSALTPAGIVATPDCDGWVYVRQFTTTLDPGDQLTCDFRPGDLW